MLEMNEQELNEKLAEWAGFVEADIKKRYYFTTGGERVPKWYQPSKEYSDKLPNFTQSLDACFKWLVPKLRNNENYIDINLRDFAPEMGDPYLFTIRMITNYPTIKAWQGGAETPALALCKAIEKFIDAETK